jgi:NADH dehydrogenase
VDDLRSHAREAIEACERIDDEAFDRFACAKAAEELGDLGVTVHEHAMATDIDSRGVTVTVGDRTERIATQTVVWAAGVRTAGIGEIVAGRIKVNPDLTLPGHPEISVIGDAANLEGPDGKRLPGLATVAIQQARHVAKAIRNGEGSLFGARESRIMDGELGRVERPASATAVETGTKPRPEVM